MVTKFGRDLEGRSLASCSSTSTRTALKLLQGPARPFLQPSSPAIYRKISPDLKECAISLWERGFEITDIVAMLGVSRASIYRWQAIFDELGTVVRPTIRGRDQIISRAVVDAVLILFEADHDLYLDELALWLAVNHDIAISKSALQATLQRAGLTRKLLQKVASERDEELRHQWRELQAH
ncbi:hypothetical protein DFP72DRAFT_820947, partial [Ephemerocybe angulata]